jgi:hypothetical protein
MAAAEVWFTYLLGVRFYGLRTGCLAGFILLSSIGFFALHLQILTDHLISLSLAAALYFFWRWQEEPRNRWAVGFYLALTAGFFSKSLIGLAFPLGIVAVFAAWDRQPRLLTLLVKPTGWLLLLLLTTPWLVAMEKTHPGFLTHHFLNEQILRFFGQRHPPDIVPFPIPAFWLFLGLWLMPWTMVLPEGLYRFIGEMQAGGGLRRQGRLLLAWAGVVMIFFTLSSTRIEYYSLPALPALALILGRRLDRYLTLPSERGPLWGLMALAGLGLLTLVLLPFLESLCAGNRREFIGMFTQIEPIARRVVFGVPAVALAGVAAGWRRPWATLLSYAALALLLLFFTFQTLAVLSPHLSDKTPGEYVRTQAGPHDHLVMENIEEFEYCASLAFYARRAILMVQRQGLPQFPYPVAEKDNYLITAQRLQELWQGPGRVYLLVDEAAPPPEPFLQDAPTVLSQPGKKLLVNRQR